MVTIETQLSVCTFMPSCQAFSRGTDDGIIELN